MKYFIYLFGILTMFSCGESGRGLEESPMEMAKRIHHQLITIDTHNDININNFTDSTNYTQRLETQVNLPKMEEGALDVTWLIVYTGQDSLNSKGYLKAEQNAMAKFDAIHRLCEEIASDKIELALTSADVRRIAASGKKVAMIGVENAYPMGNGMDNFEKYHQLGARYISLAHNGHNQFSDSHTGEAEGNWLHNGLSKLGKDAVKQMNRLGIMIDISHPSKEAIEQMIKLSKAPVIASHSSARALCNHSRNLDDDQLKLLKKNGGVVQTVALGAYLNAKKDSLRNKYMQTMYEKVADSLHMVWHKPSNFNNLSEQDKEEYFENYSKILRISNQLAAEKEDAFPAVDVSDFVDHIDYMIKLIGIDHVGISSDFDGGGGIEGWSDASETFNVTLELAKRGYTEEDIAKIWGGNLLRVLDEVQDIAVKLSKN